MKRVLRTSVDPLTVPTAIAASAARGQVDATGMHVRALGNRSVTIQVDASGAPPGPPTLCPDCVRLIYDDKAAQAGRSQSMMTSLGAALPAGFWLGTCCIGFVEPTPSPSAEDSSPIIDNYLTSQERTHASTLS